MTNYVPESSTYSVIKQFFIDINDETYVAEIGDTFILEDHYNGRYCSYWIKNNQIRCCVGFKESFFNEHLKQLETKRQGYYYDRLQQDC